MYNVSISADSDVGDIKKSNQDSVFAKCGVMGRHLMGLFIVADGCGGMAYGDEISNLIVTYFSRVWQKELCTLAEKKKVKGSDAEDLLKKAIEEINVSAVNFGAQVGSKVGSTLSLLLTIDGRYYIKNVGDSRIYLIRGKRMRQLTEDQSLVADMVRNKELKPDEVKSFKRKNVLTMCIGVFDKVQTYSTKGNIKNGDMFLLCCDGLHNQISSEDMVKIAKDREIPFERKTECFRMNIPKGRANDNVSSVLCRFSKRISWVKIALTAAAAIVLGAATGVALKLFFLR